MINRILVYGSLVVFCYYSWILAIDLAYYIAKNWGYIKYYCGG
tara:strand:- start:337 stop:465 length:129 start_codon:yes stop_codon:yes gene_type:complete